MAIQRAINFFRPTITSSFHEREAAVASTRKSSPEMQFITENTSAMQYPRKGMAGSRKYIHCCGVLAFKCLRTRERAIDRCFSLSFSFSPLLELARNFHPSDSAKISRGRARIEGSNNGGARVPGIIFPLCRGSVYYFYRQINVFTRALHRSQSIQGVSRNIGRRWPCILIPFHWTARIEISGPLSRWTFFEWVA